MLYSLLSTGPVTTISETDYQDKAPYPGYHRTPANYVESRPALYAGENVPSAPNRSVHYRASTLKTCDLVYLQSFRRAMSWHFLGTDYSDFITEPDHYTGLPFWSFLNWGSLPYLFPPSAIGTLVADFANVAADGEDVFFLNQLNDSNTTDLARSYLRLRQVVKDAHRTGGTFYYTS